MDSRPQLERSLTRARLACLLLDPDCPYHHTIPLTEESR
jgi:hypothetical protein